MYICIFSGFILKFKVEANMSGIVARIQKAMYVNYAATLYVYAYIPEESTLCICITNRDDDHILIKY